ncbi:N-formylglutamate amidohydrolase [Lichenifustis flavocetrariae]|uniref:N-formylglutamate amidohydrolase n=1 Tax=Lichenifustis flavocetrariae TaxID=2949735 RepID=A0AA41YW39_9HYPH|nr:N-formylglutamate amidohydrolase [Lichenifustis flavocetrariae]MCW6508385.1 N-formylglutamate amidohydrolase [Lichenifustis flavocetrariae]
MNPGEPELDPPFEVVEPVGQRSNVVLSSPHSGDVYPDRFIASARLDRQSLRRSEDAFVDSLFRGGVDCGAPLLRARFPRAFLDVNREPYELDPRMFDGRLPPFANTRSPRVAGGLGTIARVVGEAQEIYARRLSVDEAIVRIDTLYKPYHARLRQLIEEAQHQHGTALLIDCHSMPSSIVSTNMGGTHDDKVRADVVLGDRYGTSCDRRVVDVAEATLKGFGYLVERNRPYAGGFITEHYGHPATHRHALQVEINRNLYMEERTLRPTAGFATLAGHLAEMVARLTTAMMTDTRVAAE